MSSVSIKAPLRHACSGCGACCQGSVVHLISDEEVQRVEAQAQELGIDRPVVDRHLRLEQGRCVFLQDDRLCRIHGRFGGETKPLVCRQFPFVLVQTESGLRGGIDPASTAWRTTRRDGPALQPPAGAQARPAHRPEAQARVEAHLVAACEAPDARVADLLALLCNAPDAPPNLPAGFADRWLEIVKAAPLRQLLNHPAVGPDHRATLLPLLDRADGLDSAPQLALDPQIEADAIALIRDALWLRLISRIPLVQASALLLCGGALLAGWTHDEPAAYGQALATWCRLLRAGPFWQSMVPDPGKLQWLATGR